MQQDTAQKKKSNVILAIILGIVALGFYLAGIYLSTT